MEYIHKSIQDILDTPVTPDGHLNYYPFDDNYIVNQIFNWEQNIIVKSNRKFDQIVILNQPVDKLEYNYNSLYIHGTKFKHLVNMKALNEKGNFILEQPLFKPLNPEAFYRISRNANIKDQVYYD
jgi:hypothetical protein